MHRGEVGVHKHHGIFYSVNVDGRCSWYLCTHNVYDSFDEPELVILYDSLYYLGRYDNVDGE